MIKTALIPFLILASFSWSAAQEKKAHPLEKLGSTINSAAAENQPMLSPTGDTLYFVRSAYQDNVGGIQAGQDIWFSTRSNGAWTPPVNILDKLNNGNNNAVLGVSSSGDRIYLLNTYSPPVRRNRAVAYAKKENGLWGAARELELLMEVKRGFYGAYMHPSEEVLLISMNAKASNGLEDLYVSIKTEGGWSKPIHLGATLNTKGHEISPFLSAGKDSLYFASNGHGGLGETDIFVSKRLDESWQSWSEPVNLGAPVNSPAFDAYYVLHNKEAFFSSNRTGNNDLFILKNATAPVPDSKEEIPLTSTKESPLPSKEIAEKAIVKPEEVRKRQELPKGRRVYFAFDQYELNLAGRKILDQLLEEIQQHDQTKLHISLTGYTDQLGTEAYNQDLSHKRALAIEKYLLSKGIHGTQIKVLAKGEEDPFAPNDTSKGRAQNRRVEIVIKSS